jgi:hypothetical protein
MHIDNSIPRLALLLAPLLANLALSGCPAKQGAVGQASETGGITAKSSSGGKVQNAAAGDLTTGQTVLGEGWPVPELGLPPGATILPQNKMISERAYGPGCKEWSIQFSYANTFDAAVAHCDVLLGGMGYSRVRGGQNTIDPAPPEEARSSRRRSGGKRVYFAPDGKLFVFLYYDAVPDMNSTRIVETYKLQCIVFDEPQPIRPPSYLENL